MTQYTFPCGCSFPILEDNPPEGIVPLLDFDIENIPDNCLATWALLGKGLTKGVFQLESNLGKQWTKKLKPDRLDHIIALSAILRPGCLHAKDDDDVSITQHYCRRKNDEEPIDSYHPVVDAALRNTYNCMIYQEQAMAIAKAVAGFTLQDADVLRKACGKKLPAEMAKVKTMFINGAAKESILTKEQAEEVFGWIEKSQRYAFNSSHSCCYGLIGYDCAYIKAHFPLAFFTSWLMHAKQKQDPLQEINELVNDAKLFDIVVEPPDLRSLERTSHTDRKVVRFGLTDIKGVGDAQIAKLIIAIDEAEKQHNCPLSLWNWFSFLVNLSDSVSSNVVSRLIEVGALRWFNVSRSRMLAEYRVWSELTDKEKAWIKANSDGDNTSLEACLGNVARPKKEGGGAANKKRISIIKSHKQLLEHPPSPLVDTPHYIAFLEEQLLGISITCAKIDSCDQSAVNTTCKEYVDGKSGFLMFGVEVQQIRQVKVKNGKSAGRHMAFLTIADSSCALQDVVCFPDVLQEYSGLLTLNNTIILQGERDKKKDSSTLIVKKIWQAA